MKLFYRFPALLCAVATFATAQQARAFDCDRELSVKERGTLVDSIDRSYQSVQDLKGRFTQETYFAGLERNEIDKGAVYFKKPGMMDWQYEGEDTQRFISDGRTLWYYQPGLNQVTVGDFQDSFTSDKPVSFLLGLGKIKQDFDIVQACRGKDGIAAEFKPKRTDRAVQKFWLLVREKDFVPLGAKVIDAADNPITIRLEDVVTNHGIEKSHFAFEIPRGTDVIDNRRVADSHTPSQIREESLDTATR